MARSPLLGTERPTPPSRSPVEDEAADPVGDGRSDAALAERMSPPGRPKGEYRKAQPERTPVSQRPGQPNPEPDPPEDPPPIPPDPDQPAAGAAPAAISP